jgi:Fe-S cluster biogenesis protein NfuA
MTLEEKINVVEQVKNGIDQLRPYLQADGGDVEFVEMTDEGVVYVKLKGHCGSCPHALMTLKQGIETALREAIPQVTAVERVME